MKYNLSTKNIDTNDFIGVFCFNNSHTWSFKKYNNDPPNQIPAPMLCIQIRIKYR